MTGRVFAIVGPSGAGKDTLIAAACAAWPQLYWARRAVTRPESPGGEPFESVDRDAFERRRAAGRFALWWTAHGLLYGVPVETRAAAAGRTAIFNGSRASLDDARAVFPGLGVVWVDAPPALLAARLTARGRETPANIAARLSRAAPAAPADAVVVVNDGSVETGRDRLLAALSPSMQSA